MRLFTSSFERLLPQCPGTAAHCRRVAAIAREMALRLPVSWRAALTLEHAALLHHSRLNLEGESLPIDLKEVLTAFLNPFRSARRITKLLGDVLTMADMLD